MSPKNKASITQLVKCLWDHNLSDPKDHILTTVYHDADNNLDTEIEEQVFREAFLRDILSVPCPVPSHPCSAEGSAES